MQLNTIPTIPEVGRDCWARRRPRADDASAGLAVPPYLETHLVSFNLIGRIALDCMSSVER